MSENDPIQKILKDIADKIAKGGDMSKMPGDVLQFGEVGLVHVGCHDCIRFQNMVVPAIALFVANKGSVNYSESEGHKGELKSYIKATSKALMRLFDSDDMVTAIHHHGMAVHQMIMGAAQEAAKLSLDNMEQAHNFVMLGMAVSMGNERLHQLAGLVEFVNKNSDYVSEKMESLGKQLAMAAAAVEKTETSMRERAAADLEKVKTQALSNIGNEIMGMALGGPDTKPSLANTNIGDDQQATAINPNDPKNWN